MNQSLPSNKKVKSFLQKSVYENTVSNAYIFSGPAGSGKKAIAKYFAKMLLCENKDEKPCNICTSCKVFDNDNHPDMYYITTEKSIMSVDIIREQVNQPINVFPNGKYKIFVIDKADSMNVQAQNALLKTLEDTPVYAKIILLSINKNIFLSTILSRSIVVNFNEFVNKLHGDDFENLLDYTVNFVIELENQSIDGVFNFVDKLSQSKEQIQDILSIMQFFYRDCIMIKERERYVESQNIIYLISKNKIQQNFVDKFETNKFIKKFESVCFCVDALSKNANFQIAIEVMLLRIRQA